MSFRVGFANPGRGENLVGSGEIAIGSGLILRCTTTLHTQGNGPHILSKYVKSLPKYLSTFFDDFRVKWKICRCYLWCSVLF